MAFPPNKEKFENWSGLGCSNSSYAFVVPNCCSAICVEDEELHEFFYDSHDPSRHIALYVDDLPCPVCGVKEWDYTDKLGVNDGREYTEWPNVLEFDSSSLIDLSDIVDESSFHDHVMKTFGFPDYYGRNLDALWDCLTDRVIPFDNHILRIEGVRKFKEACSDLANRAIRCFIDLQTENYCKVVVFDDSPSLIKSLANKANSADAKSRAAD